MTKRAVVIGATGAVGGSLVRALLASSEFAQVVALVRRPVESFAGVSGADKLRTAGISLDDLEAATAREGHGCEAAFNCMGIGQPRKVPFEEFRRVDVEYASAFAQGAGRAGVQHLSLLSSVGANLSSASRYLRIKGEAERATCAAGIPRVSLFRPSLLVTRELRYGLQDRLTRLLFPLVAPLLPAKYHQVRVEDLGRAMCRNAEREGPPGVTILHYPETASLLR